MERLYAEYHASGQLNVADYNRLGRVKGSIEAAVERALKAADLDPAIPQDRVARLTLLRRGLIPWLAGIDPDSGAPRRRIARLAEIPPEARPLIHHLVEQRLLATDVSSDTSETTIEPVHEALLRQWGLLQGWLAEDAGLLAVLEGVKRASRDWAANAKNAAWLTHASSRLLAAERLSQRPDLAANLTPTDREYLAACLRTQQAQSRRSRRGRVLMGALAATVIILGWMSTEGWLDVTYLEGRANFVRNSWREASLNPGDVIAECSRDCLDMVVIPAGTFVMGSGETAKETPAHQVTIRNSFLVSKFEITFDQWDACTAQGACPYRPADAGWGRGSRPVMNVSWDDVQQYTKWLSQLTGMSYRLLTEAEWEYAARAGSTTRYPWGDVIKRDGHVMANCADCGSQWGRKQTAPVGSFSANAFGLHDMLGNVSEWVADIGHDNYMGAPTDGTAWLRDGFKDTRIIRGGSWFVQSDSLHTANRIWINTEDRGFAIGFRVARSLTPGSTSAPAAVTVRKESAVPLRYGSVSVLDGFKYYKQSGFNFRTEQVVAWDSLNGDILVERSDSGKGKLIFFMPGVEGGVSADTLGDMVFAGIVAVSGTSLEDIKSCPNDGYQHGPFEVHVGGLYCVRVRDGRSYAKIAVKEILEDGIKFDWVYNPTGSANF